MSHPKGLRFKPAANSAGSVGVNTASDPLLKPANGKKSGGEEISSPFNKLAGNIDSTASGSGLSAQEKASTKAIASGSVLTDEDGFLDDDFDDDMVVDLDKEASTMLRSTAILLIPFVLAQEISCIIDAVKMLMKRGWYSELSQNVLQTVKFQVLQPAYIAKVRYCRLQASFILESDAVWVAKKEVVYQALNGKLHKLHWQRLEDAVFNREKSLNPHAIEVILKGVSASVELSMIHDWLALYKIASWDRSAFLRCTCLHRVLHPVTAASLSASTIVLPLLRDPALALISTGSCREEWICVQEGCGKAHGKIFMTASEHIATAAHMLHLEKPGAATKQSLERTSLAVIRKEYGV
ncbi:unnamed protein product [Closterium sp. Naga37s-1]|nr:unnamed protein product [Closterium sp. Naga37s-1]